MILIGICDDSQSDKLLLKKTIEHYFSKDQADFNILLFDSGEALVRHYSAGKGGFDIIFLDIYMSGENGIKTAKRIRQVDPDTKIIFTTSSTQHALESFDVFPFSYLIKPITQTAFHSVIEKATRTIYKEKQKSLSFKTGSMFHTLFYKDILFIESNAKIVKIHCTNKTIEHQVKLDDMEKQLNDRRFIRCHKSFFINMDTVLNVKEFSFTLTDDTQIPITQRNFARVKKDFYDYILKKADLNKEFE